MKPASLIIPNWNGAHLLRANLPSVLAAAARHAPGAEVVVVDDGSSDDSLRVLADEFPSVRVVVHPENRGFGEACWSGVQAAQHPVAILLNSDVEVEPDFVGPLVRTFAREETFAASPLILEPGVAHAVDVSLTVPYLKRGKLRYRDTPTALLLRPEAGRVEWFTFFPLGGAVALHRQRFLDLGGFDRIYAPFYYEDVDLGFGAWRRGWTCQVVPESRVYHQNSQTIGKRFKRRKVQLVRKRNRVLLHVKNLTSTRLLLWFLLLQALRAGLGLFKLEVVAFLATLLAIPRLPAALGRRRVERRAQVLSEREMCATLQARWEEARAQVEREGQEAAGRAREEVR